MLINLPNKSPKKVVQGEDLRTGKEQLHGPSSFLLSSTQLSTGKYGTSYDSKLAKYKNLRRNMF